MRRQSAARMQQVWRRKTCHVRWGEAGERGAGAGSNKYKYFVTLCKSIFQASALFVTISFSNDFLLLLRTIVHQYQILLFTLKKHAC